MCKTTGRRRKKKEKQHKMKYIVDDSMQLDTDKEADDSYKVRCGERIHRSGKIYSYTFWRTQVENDVFWSVQGMELDGSAWMTTQYLGPPSRAGSYRYEVTLYHPTERHITLYYVTPCTNGLNRITISQEIVQLFKNRNNTIEFDFKMLRFKRRTR